jgi:hypothetical protein
MTAGFLAVSRSAERPRAISAGRLHPIMKSNARYLAVVHPGVVSGVALMTAA